MTYLFLLCQVKFCLCASVAKRWFVRYRRQLGVILRERWVRICNDNEWLHVMSIFTIFPGLTSSHPNRHIRREQSSACTSWILSSQGVLRQGELVQLENRAPGEILGTTILVPCHCCQVTSIHLRIGSTTALFSNELPRFGWGISLITLVIASRKAYPIVATYVSRSKILRFTFVSAGNKGVLPSLMCFHMRPALHATIFWYYQTIGKNYIKPPF